MNEIPNKAEEIKEDLGLTSFNWIPIERNKSWGNYKEQLKTDGYN